MNSSVIGYAVTRETLIDCDSIGRFSSIHPLIRRQYCALGQLRAK